jgi:hypothetical protein
MPCGSRVSGMRGGVAWCDTTRGGTMEREYAGKIFPSPGTSGPGGVFEGRIILPDEIEPKAVAW